jgi:hypothetical protein
MGNQSYIQTYYWKEISGTAAHKVVIDPNGRQALQYLVQSHSQ